MTRRVTAFIFAIATVSAIQPSTAFAEFLRPSDFQGMAVGSFSEATGSYVFDTDTLSFTGPGVSVSGAESNGIAIFVFDSFSLSGSAEANAIGDLPLAIVSLSSVSIDGGGIDVRAGGGQGGLPGEPGEGIGGGAPVSIGFVSGSGGGSHGGQGAVGVNAFFPAFGPVGGPTYGDLSQSLTAGSGSGGTEPGAFGNLTGAAGGGGIAISAAGDLYIGGDGIRADGEDGNGNFFSATGGGSGGGIRLRASSVVNEGVLSAAGGDGGKSNGNDFGGGGGGGRIFIETTTGNFQNIGGGSIDVGGGGSVDWKGARGSLTIRELVVPEPGALGLATCGMIAVMVRVGRRRLPRM